MSNKSVPRIVLSSLLGIASVGTISVAAVMAESQNELLIGISYDGTVSFDDDPLDNDEYPAPHTPGLDARGDNGVVRSFDSFGVRVDFNINEDAATNAIVTATLPENVNWVPAPQTNPPHPSVPAGCLSEADGVPAGQGSYISDDGRTLVCNTGDHAEGANVSLYFDAFVGALLDGTQLTVDATLTTDDDADGVADQTDPALEVSARPSGDWVKQNPETFAATRNGVEGTVYLYPLSFSWEMGGRGSEPINTNSALTLYDHAWDLPASAVLAEPALLGGRTPCGQYDGDDATYQITNGAWTCSDVTGTAPYNIIEMAVDAGYSAGNAGEIVLAGQVAFWISDADLDARWDLSEPENTIYNSISGSADDRISIDKNASPSEDPADDITPIGVPGSNSIEPEATSNNTAIVLQNGPFEPIDGGTDGTVERRMVQHSVDIIAGSYQQLVFTGVGDEPVTYTTFDGRRSFVGGLWQPGFLPQARDTERTVPPISRGEHFVIHGMWSSEMTTGGSIDTPFHGCLALDTRHYELIPFGEIVEYTVDPEDHTHPNFANDPSSSSKVVSPSDGSYVHVVTGSDSVATGTHRDILWTYSGAVGGDPLPYRVEFGIGTPLIDGTPGFTVGEDEVRCNDSDATEWIEASAATDAQVAEANRVRIIRTSSKSWDGDVKNPDDVSQASRHYDPGPGMSVYLQARVKADLEVQVDGEELLVFAGRAIGAWDDAAGAPERVGFRNSPSQPEVEAPASSCVIREEYGTAQSWTDDDNTFDTITSWCNEPYVDFLGPDNFPDTAIGQHGLYNRSAELHADKRYIATARPVVAKQPWDVASDSALLTDFADNGDTAYFRLAPSVVGATTEAVSNVRFVDDLTATNYQFIRYVQLPDSTNGYSCNSEADAIATNIVSCQYSEPTSDDTGPLAPGLPGGWDDPDADVIIEVELGGAVANTPPTFNSNSVVITSDAVGKWSDGAFADPPTDLEQSHTATAGTYMPNPWSGSAIIKAVPTQEGPCELHPTEDVVPETWGDRCQMIDFNGNMTFTLSIENLGNTELSNLRFVDVFPHLGDGESEANSNTTNQGVDEATDGDARTPASDIAADATLGYLDLADADGTQTVWVTKADPQTVSRDPDAALADITWCDGVAGDYAAGPDGDCPLTAEEVTATYSTWAGPLRPGDTYEQTLLLDSEGVECDDNWTNTFGARADELLLPIRSNDVTIMVNCEFDLALRKTVDPEWTADEAWVTPGTSTVDFLIEVFNQGDPVEDFDVTEYFDTDIFTFDVANNTATETTDAGVVLPFTWDVTNPDQPVALVDGPLATGESVVIPVTMTVSETYAGGALINEAEISRFDFDGDPETGDSNPDNPNNPSGQPLVDVDSIPDDVNNEGADGKQDDDVIDNSGGDEDDQDLAELEAPTYSLGNQVWTDDDNDGVLDEDETPIAGVIVDLFTDADGDGKPDDLNGDGIIDGNDAVATTTTDDDGGYLFTDLAWGDYIVGISPDNFDPGGALESTISSTPTTEDPNDGVDDDDNGIHDYESGYVLSGPVNLGAVSPTNEPGLANDPDTLDSHSDLTIDFGFWVPVFDVALRKTIDSPKATYAVGDIVTYNIEVFNQGNLTVADIDVLDTPPAGLVIVDSAWTVNNDGSATRTIPGPIEPGDSTVVTVKAQIVSSGNGSLVNVAEITEAKPVDPDGTEIVDAEGNPLDDVDSVADDEFNNDTLVDDVIDNNNGDEDDHDIAAVTVASPLTVPTTGTIPATGSSITIWLGLGAILMLGGWALCLAARRRPVVV